MSRSNSTSSSEHMSQVAWAALAVLLLTSVHHVYGAYVYHTPWRLHAAFLSVLTASAIVGSLLVLRRSSGSVAGTIAFWIFAGVTLAIPVGAIGLFEGAYNHALKDVLFFAGSPGPLLRSLFPPPTYELPNDAFFEITGVMQVVPAGVTGWLLYRVLRSRLASSSSRADARRPHRSDQAHGDSVARQEG